MRMRKTSLLEKEINVVDNIIAENIFKFILYSYFTSHKTIIQEISRIQNPAFSINKVYKFKYFSNSFGQKNAEDRLHFLP